MTKEFNDHNLDQRMLDQCSEIMEHLEMVDVTHPKLPFKERISAMSMIHTVRKDFRKDEHEPDNAGSAVRKYTSAFADGSSRRTSDGRGADVTDDDAGTTKLPS
jgi:hypothetical protein